MPSKARVKKLADEELKKLREELAKCIVKEMKADLPIVNINNCFDSEEFVILGRRAAGHDLIIMNITDLWYTTDSALWDMAKAEAEGIFS